MADDYVPRETMQTACPSCASRWLACIVGTELDICMACYRVWERLPSGEPYTVDDEQMAFAVPCNNCAFRGGSAERADAEAWRDLQNMLAGGGEFYCHKGVAFRAPSLDDVPPYDDRAFEFPRKTATVDLGGACHAYSQYDKSKMRLCRGYLNAHVGPLMRKVFCAS